MMLTRDENIVQLNIAAQFKVKDAKDFLFNVRDPVETLEQAAESAMRQVVGDHDMDFVLLEGRSEMRADIADSLQGILDFYGTGLELTTVNLEDVRPPRQVKDAFDDAIKAREDKERYENLASAYANGVVPKARGRGARIVQEAEGYKASTIARATGESERFVLLLNEYTKAPEVTRQRLYLETMESVLGDSSKVLLDVEQGNNVMYLPLDQLMKNTVPALQRNQDSARPSEGYSPEGGRPTRESGRGSREGN
jgi:membrane protease subunit HflK